MAIVTISHEMGAGGPTIGTAVAERLGCRYADQGIIARAAHEYGLGVDRLTHLAEARPSVLERFDAETRHYIAVLESALLEIAEGDDAVIMGRSGQLLLAGIAHVLRLFVRAPFEMRVRRVMAELAAQAGGGADVRTTGGRVRRSDQEKYGRMRYLFDVDWRDPALYDLVISTEALSTEAAVDLVVGVLHRPELAATDASRQAVSDRALAARVRAALAAHPATRKHRFTVEAARGAVSLDGTEALERAADIARTVPGTVDVRIRPLEVLPIASLLS